MTTVTVAKETTKLANARTLGATIFDSVADLVADTTLGYSGSTTIVSAGDYVSVRKENVAYEVLASGGSGDITNSNGTPVQLKVLPGEKGYDVRAFNAKGDGTTDDSTAIQQADTRAAAESGTVWFSDGTYAAAELTQTTGWDMSPNAKILFNGAEQGEIVRNSATGSISGRIHIDGGGLEPRTGIYIDGSDNIIDLVVFENVVSSNVAWGVVRSVYVTGNRNTVRQSQLRDLVNTGNTNDSSPQGVVTDGTADLNDLGDIWADNCRATVVNASTGANFYGRIVSYDAKDNGFYSVNAGTATVNEVVYDGDDNAIGFRSSTNVSIGTVDLTRTASTSIFFGDCGDINIGTILVNNNSKEVLHLNVADTGHIKIGTIQGTLYNTTVFEMPVAQGDVRSLTIGNVDLRVDIDDLSALSQDRFMMLTAVQQLNLGRVKIDVVLDTISTSTFFYCDVKGTLVYESHIESLRVGMYDTDGITLHPTAVFFARNVSQDQLYLGEGILDGNANIRAYNYGTFQTGVLVGGAIPTAGTWRRGQIIWAESPSASNPPGWVCVTAGSPGTWKAMANLAA